MKDSSDQIKPSAILINATETQRRVVTSAFNHKSLADYELKIEQTPHTYNEASLLIIGDSEDPAGFIMELLPGPQKNDRLTLVLTGYENDSLDELEALPGVLAIVDPKSVSHEAMVRLILANLRLAGLYPKEVREPKEKLHEFLQYIADGIIIVDAQGGIKEFNSAALSIFGANEDDLREKVFGFPTVAGEKTEIEIIKPDGKQVIAEMNVAEVTWRGEPCLLASIRDVTGRKEAEKRVEEALEFSETVISSSPLGICTYTSDGQCVSANDSMAEILGVPKDRILAQNFRESDVWKELGLLNDAEFTLTTAAHSSREVNVITSGGKEVWLECNFSRFTSGGEPHLLLTAVDIWSRKQADNLIRKSERRFRTIFETAPVSMWEIEYSEFMEELEKLKESGLQDLRNHIRSDPGFLERAASMIKAVDVNSAALRTFGAGSKSEILGAMDRLLHPDSMRGFSNELIALAEGKRFLEFETVRQTLDNRRLDLIMSMAAQGATKDPHKALCAMVDITERKQAESRLARELEINEAITELFATLLAPSSTVAEIAAIVLEKAQYLTGSEHGYVSEIDHITEDNVSHTLTKMMGEECEVDHKTGVIFPIGKDRKYKGLWGHVLNTRTSLFTNSPSESPFSTGLPEGHIPIHRFLAVPVMENDHLLGQIALANSTRDYTQDDLESVERLASYYALALQRKRIETELTNSEERFRQLAENIRDVFMLINFWGGEKVDYVSPAYETIWGRDRKEVYEDSRAWLRSVHPDDRSRVTQEFESQLNDWADYSSEFRIIRPDDQVRWVWFKGFSIRDSDGTLLRITGLAQDITEFKISQAQQRQLMEEIKHFAYIVSHDLRAPLINLKGFSRELKMAIEGLKPVIETGLEHVDSHLKDEALLAVNEDLPESLEFIDSSATKMNALINGILRLSRLGRAELAIEPVDMNEVVKDCLKTLAYQINENNTIVRVEDLPVIMADRTSMDQIMNNLLSNAIKFMPPDREGHITIGARESADGAIFFVKDNGPGIKQQDQEKIFEVFSRVGDQNVPGEGMGLAYVRTLVRRHGGGIWCESEPGRGAVFKFTISNRALQDISDG